MDASLLATKLRIPPQPRQVVRRDRLVAAIEHGIFDDAYKIVLFAAPAGYGKTTLLAQWACSSHAQVVWLSLEEADNDVERFLRSLLVAWEVVQPGLRDSSLGLLLGAMNPDRDAVLAAYINAATSIADDTVFVLDDFHLIADPNIHAALTFLIDHAPPNLHVVVAGRAEPPLPLARYRARHELLELRTEELQFDLDESELFLLGLMDLPLTREEIVALHQPLEGWIAGLQLASLALRRRREPVDTLVVSGRQRFIADFLSDEILARQTEDIRSFLLQTSLLDRLCGGLCAAVATRENSQELLEHLERENLFLVPLDDRREWYRYHHLFADFLQAELHRRHAGEVGAIHRRAARWYLAQDLPEQAFHHAVDGSDLDLAIDILERYMAVMLQGGELRVLQGWLDTVPEASYAANPMLGLARAGILMYTGELDACVRCVDDVERRLEPLASDDAAWQQAEITAFRCFVACFQNDLQRAEVFATQALRDLPADDVSYRGDVYHALGETYGRHGRWEQARAHYLKALDFSHPSVTGLRSVHVFGALADLDLRQGRLRDAGAHWQQALTAVQEPANWGRLPLPVTGWVYLRLAEFHYERNELEEARDYLSRGLERAKLGGDARTLIAGFLMACRVNLTTGDIEAAAVDLEQARLLVEPATFPDWSSRFERRQVELWLAQERLRTAVDWADTMLRDGVLETRPQSETARLALVRVLIVKGDAPSRTLALTLLETLLQEAVAEGRMAIEIEALALRALALWQGGDRAGALTALDRALGLAEREGYVRLFADLGPPMARILQEARRRQVMPEYVRPLLEAFTADVALDDRSADALPEPLSEREQEVLRLMAAGLTNREIAEKLFISAETVKKHTSSIYTKFGVGHRTQAIARARELRFLDNSR